MDIFKSLEEKNTLMMEAYKDFRDLCEQLKYERAQGGLPHQVEASALAPESEYMEDFGLKLESELLPNYNERSWDEFPEQRSFSFKDINPEDPAFWTGKSIGIPIAVVVRDGAGKDKLLPIINGRFGTDVL